MGNNVTFETFSPHLSPTRFRIFNKDQEDSIKKSTVPFGAVYKNTAHYTEQPEQYIQLRILEAGKLAP